MTKGTETDPHNRLHDAKLNIRNVIGVPWLPSGPAPDDVVVGVDGSTAEHPRPRKDIVDPRFGPGRDQRTHGGWVVRVDVATAGATVGAYLLKQPGVYYLGCVFDDEMQSQISGEGKMVGGLDAKLVTPEKLARVEAATEEFFREAYNWIWEKNGGDPRTDAFPADSRFDLRHIGISPWAIIERSRLKGEPAFSFGTLYSWRKIRENAAPINMTTVQRSTEAQTSESLEVMRESLRAQQEANRINSELLAALLAERTTTTKEKSR
jgi:hypothetical protein